MLDILTYMCYSSIMKFQDLTLQKFNKLTVIKYFGKTPRGQSIWECVCDCGNTHKTTGTHLKTGQVKSCGCLARGLPRQLASTLHGMHKSTEYNSYHSAKKRCKLDNTEKYSDYAGRGIEFRFNSFDEFYQEVGPRPEPKFEYSLERIDNNGHYEKGNVKWATKKQQARNRRCDNCAVLELEIQELKNHIALFRED